MPSGYSSLGGQVLNPYDTALTPSGSSSGSGAAVALRQVDFSGGALVGARIGVVTSQTDVPTTADRGHPTCHESALRALCQAGATLEDVELPTSDRDVEMFVLSYEFALGVDRYLAGIGPGAPMRSLADLQAWNNRHPSTALKFGQTQVDRALAIDHDLERAAYLVTQARNRAEAADILEGGLGCDREILIFPGASGCSLAARAGWPSVVVPAGYGSPGRRPIGVMLVSRPGTDARLLSAAHSLELTLPVRRPPADVNPAAYR